MIPRETKIKRLQDYCRSLPAATEDIKWESNLVFSVGGKMFAAWNHPDGEPFSFKADPHVFADLTQRPGIEPAAYLARALWVSLQDCEVLPLGEIKSLLFEAHAIVSSRLPLRTRVELGLQG